MIAHAARLGHGGIYVPPSVDFVPFPYTPLYPTAIGGLGAVTGVGYGTARAISVLAIAAIVAVIALTAWRGSEPGRRWLAVAAAALGAGTYAAAYPFVEGWYDIAKPDSFATALSVVGVWLLLRALRRDADVPGGRAWRDWRRHAAVGIAAAVLALGYFAKQTGVFFVVAGGGLVVVWSWRRLPIYAAVAAVIGLGGTGMLNAITDGRFWSYIYEVKQGQDFNMDRFWGSFEHILGRFPVITVALAAALALVVGSWAITRRLPRAGAVFLSWLWIFAVACVMGAAGWAAPWGHFNHYIPAFATLGVTVAAAVPAVRAALAELPALARWSWSPLAGAAALAAVVGLALGLARWSPRPFVPDRGDHERGARLIAHLARIDGDVLMPFHPWYPRLAGKRFYLHRMGILDMSYPRRRPIEGLAEAIAERRFAAIVLDNRNVIAELPGLTRYYERTETIPPDERPRVFTGAKVVPEAIWTPRPIPAPSPPPPVH
jgi:4-amino-4-deoxy-L-arabinose transferase-like glycosyltransferase